MPKMTTWSILGVGVCASAMFVGGAGVASAGEITGNGKPTQGPAHATSICAFSGQEDAEGGGPPQNWGHSKTLFGATPAERKASGFQPGDSCNGHRGFLAGGGME